ncbi:hypothetical protein JCM19045_73 [Bacillus sp. JCM 19045]|nr:hypothetical protein JCM19045_73 [Bacillus sp. JCM 19045]
MKITLPNENRQLVSYTLKQQERVFSSTNHFHSRRAYSAAHVVADPLSVAQPVLGGEVEWEATLAYRRSLWQLVLASRGNGYAQRGMGLSWEHAKELIARSAREARACGGLIASGAGTDQLDQAKDHSVDAIIAAYEQQVDYVESHGSKVILMASRALARTAQSPEMYKAVYGRLLRQVKEPVILHWLGEMFDPALTGYWGSADVERAMDACLEIIHLYADKIDGIKISLLDKDREVTMRNRLPQSVRMYTGDDFHYPDLIKGDSDRYSDALLGIFDAIAPAAASAFQALDTNDTHAYDAILAPTVPLARHIFEAPTYAYKTGIVFMAYLNGFQDHFRMIAGAEGARSVIHLAKLFILADDAGLLMKPEQAVQRMVNVLQGAGISQEVLSYE